VGTAGENMSYRTDNVWGFLKNMATGGGTFTYTPFRSIFCDPLNGSDGNDGLTLSNAKKTLAAAYAIARDGANDTIFLVSSGLAAGTARVDAAFSWVKNATHLVGICPPNSSSLRARIAPTSATTAFTPFFTHSGSGCYFKNIQLWHGFGTGAAAQINLLLNEANYNRFENCHIAGMGDAASAASATSRALKLIGADDNEFVYSTIGIDTIARTAANRLVEFVVGADGNGCARNRFGDCVFPAWTTTVQTQTDFYAGAANGIDRTTLIERCLFVNAIKASGYLVQTAIAELVAGQNGVMLFKDCSLVGRTGFGKDATTRGFLLIDGAAPTNSTSGIAVAPSA
jgi:hypothetical protein